MLRIHITKVTLEKGLQEWSRMILSRNYNKNVVKNTVEKVKEMERAPALNKAAKNTNKRVVLALKYHPKLPSVTQIIRKYRRNLTNDHKMLILFPSPHPTPW
jgi:hypothetical protein